MVYESITVRIELFLWSCVVCEGIQSGVGSSCRVRQKKATFAYVAHNITFEWGRGSSVVTVLSVIAFSLHLVPRKEAGYFEVVWSRVLGSGLTGIRRAMTAAVEFNCAPQVKSRTTFRSYAVAGTSIGG
jgi:hypothetical protein